MEKERRHLRKGLDMLIWHDPGLNQGLALKDLAESLEMLQDILIGVGLTIW